MSNWLIRYPKGMVSDARHRGHMVFAVGYSDDSGPAARHEFSRTVDHYMASCLFSFSCAVMSGMSPRAAFDAIAWPGDEVEVSDVAQERVG